MTPLRPAIILALLSAAAAHAQPLVIKNAIIVDGLGGQPYRGAVVVEGERITAAGRQVEAPPGAHIVDAGGKTLLPGLFDLHTHLTYSAVSRLAGDWADNLRAYLYCGVTSVVEFGAYPEQFEPMRRLLAEGVVEGPRIHRAARVSPPYGHGLEGGRGDFFSYTAFTPEDGRAVVRSLLPFKPDAIKIFTDGWRYGYADDMASMTPDTIAAITAAAHAEGLEVLTHTVTVQGAKDAAAAGVDVIDHAVGDAEADGRLISLLLEHKVTYAPTLAVYHPQGRDILDAILAAVVEPDVKTRVRPALRPPDARSRLVNLYKDPTSPRAARWRNVVANNRKLHAAGVRFGAGTDSGVTSAWHGWSTLRELQLLVHAGLTPLEAITAATAAAARALHVDADRGEIAPGKLADLVLVDGAPHERIADIERIFQVYLGGRLIDRAKLAEQIAAPGMSPLPSRRVPELLDDFEGQGRRSAIGTNWVNTTDNGLSHSEIRFERIAHGPGDRSMIALARMSQEDGAWASVNLPLSPGGIEPVDLSGYTSVEFEARGEGEYMLVLASRGVRNYVFASTGFKLGPKWSKLTIPLERFDDPRTEATHLMFRIQRDPGESAWLELDNLRLH